MKRHEAYSAERALAIVRVRLPLNGSVRCSLEASACEQSRVFALLNRSQAFIWYQDFDLVLKNFSLDYINFMEPNELGLK
jgi:hypothetical protein